MKLSHLIFTCVLTASSVCMAQVPVQTTVEEKTNVYKPLDYAVRKAIRIHNQHGYFTLKALLKKPDAKLQQQRKLHLDCGQYGFSPHVDFMRLTVNGIPDLKIDLKQGDLKPWQEGNKKGGQLLYRFDGANIRMFFYMRPDSPVLWFRFVPVKGVTPYKSIKIRVGCLISNVLKKNGKIVFHGGYNRKVQTAVRTLSQSKKLQTINPNDKYLLLYDLINDGSAKDKGQGPLYIALGNTPVKSIKLGLQDNWASNLTIELPVNFKEYTIGLWQPRKGMSNKAFFAKVKKEKSAFALK